jgi:Barstar (barnase inhibitor)
MTENLAWQELLSMDSPWAYLTICSEGDIDDFVIDGIHQNQNSVVRIVRGRRCSELRLFFQEWAAALQFPWYFTEGWPGFDECINDLSWLGRRPFIVFVTDIDKVLDEREQDFDILIDILRLAAEQWVRPSGAIQPSRGEPIQFAVVFHGQPEHESVARIRLSRTSIQVAERAVPRFR